MSSRSRENTGRWSKHEHDVFINGLRKHGKEWKVIAALVGTRTVVQIRTHAQKYFQKLSKLGITNPVADIQRGRIPPYSGVKRRRDSEPRTPRRSSLAPADDDAAVASPTAVHSKHTTPADMSTPVAAPTTPRPRSTGASKALSSGAGAGAAARPRSASAPASPGAFHVVTAQATTDAATARLSSARPRSASDAHASWGGAGRSRGGPRVISTHRAAPDQMPRSPLHAASLPMVDVAPVVNAGPPNIFVRLPVLNVYGSATREYGVDSSYPYVQTDDMDDHDSPVPSVVGDESPTGVMDILYAFPTGNVKDDGRVSPVPDLTAVMGSMADHWSSHGDMDEQGDYGLIGAAPSAAKRQRTATGALSKPCASYAKHPAAFDVDAFVDGLLASH